MAIGYFTKPLYMSKPLLSSHTAEVVAMGACTIKNKQYTWIQLDDTIFYPQGGGQPSDKGTINGFSVDLLCKVQKGSIDIFDIQHCFSEPVDFEIGQRVQLEIDLDVRKLHMRMHTAGHAIADFVQSAYPNLKAVGGNHFPNDGYMKFKLLNGSFPTAEEVKASLTKSFENAVEAKLPCQIQEEDQRKLKIGDFEGVPCGGTHMQSIEEIGSLEIGKITNNNKEQTLCVKYKVA